MSPVKEISDQTSAVHFSTASVVIGTTSITALREPPSEDVCLPVSGNTFDVKKSFYPRVCQNEEQFEAWKKTCTWLAFDCISRSVKCTSCLEIKHLGLHTAPGQHINSAFVEGTVMMKDAKTLLKKIDKHRDSTSHRKCEEILVNREREEIHKSLKIAEERFVEHHKENIHTTDKVLRTA